MTIHTPQYYLDFRCLAGDCPHTCCQGWEVPIDPVTARYYESLPGPMGERLRALLSRDEMGEAAFRLRGGLCPFLNGDGLCEIYIQLGEERTGEICRTHPRFTYEYGPLTEKGLCGSCPETVRLILGSDMTLLTAQEEGIGEETPELLKPLLRARETAISLFDREGTSMGERLQALLLFANEVQVLLDEGQEEAMPRLCEIYEEEFPLLDPAALPQGFQRICNRRRSGGKSQSRRSAFQSRHTLFQHILRGVCQSSVDIAGIGKAKTGRRMCRVFEYIGSSRVNRHCTGVSCRVRILLAYMEL